MPTTILTIMAGASKPLAMDDFTDLLWKTGYARVRLEVDSRLLLKTGVLVKERKGIFW